MLGAMPRQERWYFVVILGEVFLTKGGEMRSVSCIAIGLLVILSSGVLNAAEDNCVFICGDTPDLRGLKSSADSILEKMKIEREPAWNDGKDADKGRGYDEFWSDTYLMWELAYTKGKFPDNKAGSPVDHIHILYGYGWDYPEAG